MVHVHRPVELHKWMTLLQVDGSKNTRRSIKYFKFCGFIHEDTTHIVWNGLSYVDESILKCQGGSMALLWIYAVILFKSYRN